MDTLILRTRADDLLKRVARESLKPRTQKPCDNWTEDFVRLSSKFTATPGPLRFSRSPAMRGPHQWFSDPNVWKIVGEKSAQTGGTTFLADAAMYAIAEDPGPIMYVTSTGPNGQSWVEREFQPRVEDCDPVRVLKPDDEDDYKKMEMHFKSCTFRVVGSNSPANLASRPIRYLFCDEVDKWPQDNAAEASALDLAEARTISYKHKKKIVVISTPTVETGTIHVEYLKGSQHKYFVPCPFCEKAFELKFFIDEATGGGVFIPPHCRDARGRWDLEAVEREAAYICPCCAKKIPQDFQKVMVETGTWVATNLNAPKGFISFHISAMYTLTWGQMAKEFLLKKDTAGGLHDFYNNYLGLPWVRQSSTVSDDSIDLVVKASPEYYVTAYHRQSLQEALDAEALRNFQNVVKLPIPLHLFAADPMAVALTVDVQQTNFWWCHRLWLMDETSFLLDYGEAFNNDDLMRLVNIKYKFTDKMEPMSVFIGLIDSGYKAKRESGVYDFCLASGGRFIPCQGRSTQHGFFVPVKEHQFLHRQQLMTLLQYNDSMFKQELYHRRILAREGPRWFLPRNTTLEYRQHLQGERLTEEVNARSGETELIWKEFGPNHLGDTEKEQLVFSHFASTILKRLTEVEVLNDKQN
jgi:phage terminase large subunit GpA-like protein